MTSHARRPPRRAPRSRAEGVARARAWYWVFGGLIRASACWPPAPSGSSGASPSRTRSEAFARFVAPNSAELRFKRAGQYTVYYEYQSKIDDTEIDAAAHAAGRHRARHAGRGRPEPRAAPHRPTSLRYDVGGFQGGRRCAGSRIDQAGPVPADCRRRRLAPFASRPSVAVRRRARTARTRRAVLVAASSAAPSGSSG